MDKGLPWMTFNAIRFIDRKLSKNMRVFEYGSGGSTLFFCRRAQYVISVEHDRSWYELVKTRLEKKNITNWEGTLIEPEFAGHASQSIADPLEYGTDDPELTQYRFKNYASSIDSFPDRSFDWIIVDGRSRPSCMQHAMPKLKPGGYLLLDNSDRDYYLRHLAKQLSAEFTVVCDQAGPVPFMEEFSRTTIWQKTA
jgi:hypothetical protein